MKTLTVDLGTRSYPIHIGPGLITEPDILKPHIHGTQHNPAHNKGLVTRPHPHD